jgi:hypothetical protein
MADTSPPTITLAANRTALKAGETALITLTLSEVATDFVLSDITFSGGTLSNFAGSGLVYSAIFTPNSNSTSQGSVSVGNFKFSDAAGNANDDGTEANNRLTFNIDTLSPTISISSDRTYLGFNETPTIYFLLSEPSSNFNLLDVKVSGGILSSFTGSGTLYSAVFTPNITSDCFLSIYLGAFTDTAGNENVNSTSIRLIPFDFANANVTWSRQLDTNYQAYALTTGIDGAIYVSGFINTGLSDAFITKYTPDGVKVWTRLLGSNDQEKAYALTTGIDGAIYVSGFTGGNLDSEINAGGQDTFITKYTPDGVKVWTRLLGNNGQQQAYALTTGIDGAIYVSGFTGGNLDSQINAGFSDAFISKFTSDGVKVWSRLLGTIGYEYGRALTTGLDGSIYVSGWTSGNLDMQINNGAGDTFLTKYSPDGTKAWTRQFGSSGDDSGTSLATGLDGSIYVAGYTLGPIDGEAYRGSFDAFITKYNPDGIKLWTRLFGSNSSEKAYALTTGADGSIYVGSESSSGKFVTQFNPDGTQGWTRQIISRLLEESVALTTGANGSLYFSTDAVLYNLTVPDTSKPKLALNSNKTSLKVGEFASIVITLSKPSTNFVQSDVTVQGGTLSNFEGSGVSYSAVFTASIEGANGAIVSVGSGKFSDALGIFNEDGADANNKVSFTVTVPADTTPPTIAVSSNNSSLQGGDTAILTFTLSEASSNFTASDIIVAGGILSNFTGSGVSYAATFTLGSNSTLNGTVSIANGVFTDAAGNKNADELDPNNSLNFTRLPTIINETHVLSVIVDKNVLGASATLLKELKESIIFTNGTITKHLVEYAGLTFDYNQIDSLITTVTRDGEFTTEFTKEINDYLGAEKNISYSAAVVIVGVASIDGIILSVAGSDGNFVG